MSQRPNSDYEKSYTIETKNLHSELSSIDGNKEAEEAEKRTGTIASSTFNLCKSAIGVGILSLPFCMAKSGIILGTLILVFCSFASTVTLLFLSRIAANTDLGDYYLVGKLAYGMTGEITGVLATLFFLCGGGLIAYAYYSGIYLQKFFIYALGFSNVQKPADLPFYLSKYATVSVACCLIFPLAILRDLNKIAPASIAGLCLMGAVCVLTVVDYIVYAVGSGPVITEPIKYTLFKWDTGPIKAFTLILFAFCNHFTMLAVVPKLTAPTPKRRKLILTLSSSIVLVFYLVLAIFGYLHFGDNVNKNILLAPDKVRLPYAIAQLLVALIIILSFPLLCDPARSCIVFLLEKWTGPPQTAMADVTRNLIITAGLVVYSGLVAVFGDEALLSIMGVFSAFCGSLLMFIFPSVYFLRLSYKYRMTNLEKILAYGSIVLGVFVLIFGSYFNACDAYNELFGSNLKTNQ